MLLKIYACLFEYLNIYPLLIWAEDWKTDYLFGKIFNWDGQLVVTCMWQKLVLFLLPLSPFLIYLRIPSVYSSFWICLGLPVLTGRAPPHPKKSIFDTQNHKQFIFIAQKQRQMEILPQLRLSSIKFYKLFFNRAL